MLHRFQSQERCGCLWKANKVREWVLLNSRFQYGEADNHDFEIGTPASRQPTLEQWSIRRLSNATLCQGLRGSLILIDKNNLIVQMPCPTRSVGLGAALPP